MWYDELLNSESAAYFTKTGGWEVSIGQKASSSRRRADGPPAGVYRENTRYPPGPGPDASGDGGHLRLPAERGRQPAHSGDAAGYGVRFHRRSGPGGHCGHEYLRHPGPCGKAGLRHPGRPDPHEKGEPGADHLPVRLYGPAAGGGPEGPGELSPCGPGVRAPGPVEVPGAAVPGVYPPGPGVLRGERARLHCRGNARGPGGPGSGVGVHHVWVQQLLLVLHRPLRPGPGAQPLPGEDRGGGPPAGGGGV